jgi:DNA methylase
VSGGLPSFQDLQPLRKAALDVGAVAGYTHKFYRYPARFSPQFARACIEAFSTPGEVILDPFMGGGTTVVEGMALGRRTIGSDINSLAVFVAETKCTQLSEMDCRQLRRWATETVPSIRYWQSASTGQRSPKNMQLAQVRGLRKTIALCLDSLSVALETAASRRFATCVLLNCGQWALDGRRRVPTPGELRRRITSATDEMLTGSVDLARTLQALDEDWYAPLFTQQDVEKLDKDSVVKSHGPVDLVVTSPPYPGIHMLYHRWQIDGRKESDAPYWIAKCLDGSGATYYNFADRRLSAEDRYYAKARRAFAAIRRVMRPGAVIAQLVAFPQPERHLRRYLTMMEAAGFDEMRARHARRIWRTVPGRRWHANSKGQLSSSKEVVLLHVAA